MERNGGVELESDPVIESVLEIYRKKALEGKSVDNESEGPWAERAQKLVDQHFAGLELAPNPSPEHNGRSKKLCDESETKRPNAREDVDDKRKLYRRLDAAQCAAASRAASRAHLLADADDSESPQTVADPRFLRISGKGRASSPWSRTTSWSSKGRASSSVRSSDTLAGGNVEEHLFFVVVSEVRWCAMCADGECIKSPSSSCALRMSN